MGVLQMESKCTVEILRAYDAGKGILQKRTHLHPHEDHEDPSVQLLQQN